MIRNVFSAWLFWVGVALFVVGVGPLLLYVALARWQGDPNPNPVGPGILAMFTFWPSLLLMLAGVMQGILCLATTRR